MTKRLLQFIVVLLIVIYIALWFSPVQTFIADQVANVLSTVWDTEVSIGKVKIKPLSNFEFEQVFIGDQYQDTLFYADYVEAAGYNVLSLLYKEIDIGTATVRDVVFKLQRPPQEKEYNIRFLIAFFEGDGTQPAGAKFKFSLKQARLHNIRFNYLDAAQGTEITTTLKSGHIDAYDVDMIGKRVWGDTAVLEGAVVRMHIMDPIEIPGIDSTYWDPLPVDSASTIPDWNVWSRRLGLKNLDFKLVNDRIGIDKTRQLDFSDLHFDDINLAVDSFCLHKEAFSGWLRRLDGTDHRGFAVKSMKGHVQISPKELAITKFRLETNHSSLGDSLVFNYDGYADFKDFVNQIQINSTLKNCEFTFSDIAAFAPPILLNEFIGANKDKPIRVDGTFKGKINDFRAKNMDIRIGQLTHIAGTISINEVTNPDATFMDFNLREAKTNYEELRSIIPFVKLPKELQKFGTVQFKGNYTGFFQDFVALGQINTALGTISSDLKLNLRGGLAQASYQGGLQLSNFNIGKLINNRDVGKISLQTKIQGRGLTLESLDAQLKNARIDSFMFRTYAYENILVDGQVKQKKFIGDIISSDENINFQLTGIVNLNNTLPEVNVLGKINSLKLKNINLSEEVINIHLDTFSMDATGNNIDNFEGELSVKGIEFQRGKVIGTLPSLEIIAKDNNTDTTGYASDSSIAMESHREVLLRSDVINAELTGDFQIVHVGRSIEQFLRRNHPNLFKKLNYTTDSTLNTTVNNTTDIGTLITEINQETIRRTVPHQDFELKVSVTNSKNLTELLVPDFKSLQDIDLYANYNGTDEQMTVDGTIGRVEFANFSFNDIDIEGGAIENRFDLKGGISSMEMNDTTFLPGTLVSLDAVGDSVLFSVNTSSIGNVASNIAMQGKLEVKEKAITIKLDNSNLNLLGIDWNINDDNYIRIGDNTLDIHNIRLTSQDKSIAVSTLNKKGLSARVENIDLGWLYGLGEPLPQIQIDGKFSADASIGDLFKQKDIKASVYFDTLIINNDYWGSNSKVVAHADSLKSTFFATFTHNSSFMDTVLVNAEFTPAMATKDPKKSNLLEIDANMRGAKAKILEYFLTDQISKTKGSANARAKVSGNIDGKNTKLNITGKGEMLGLITTVNMLNTRYAIDDGKLTIDNSGFHIDNPLVMNGQRRIKGGVALVEVSEPDKKGYISGSLTHDHLKNFGLDLTAYFENNLVMNTTGANNEPFYGVVYASGTANFIGPFEKLKLTVDALSEPNSELVLPLGSPLEVAENNYITFVDKSKAPNDSIQKSIKEQVWGGLDVEINARVTPDIKMKLIFDEKAGDVMQGTGFGNLTINYTSLGEIKIFGDYVIEEGNYLFTFKNFLNKPFEVKKGGSIIWGDNDGDPFKARLDIQAVYKKNIALTNLIAPYIATNPDLATLASKSTEVNIIMNLKGELFSPDITFDIEVQDMDPRLRTYVDLVLKTIRNDNTELNRQVFGVITLQQFLPVDNAQNANAAAGLGTGFISTLSEMLSQQLSLYVNGLLANVIEGSDIVSNFELDLNFNYQGEGVSSVDESANSNVQLGSDVSFFDNRLRVYAGANVDIANNNSTSLSQLNNTNGTSQFGGDFIVEYYLTPTGELKIRGYGRTESTILGRGYRTGVGLSYRKEFDSVKELIESFKTNKTKNIEGEMMAIETKINKLNKKAIDESDIDKKRAIELEIQKLSEKQVLKAESLTAHKSKIEAREKRKRDRKEARRKRNQRNTVIEK